MQQLLKGSKIAHIIEDRNELISRFEQEKQNMRNMRSRLDVQLDLFAQIHNLSQKAFQVNEQKDLLLMIAEGVVDIFQLEVGVIYGLDITGENLVPLGACNLEAPSQTIPLSRTWLMRREMVQFAKQGALFESPVTDPPFHLLSLAHAVYVPLFNNEKELDGIILGGITQRRADLYDFHTGSLLSAFMVYCQQMNGIYNNFNAIARAKAADEAKTCFLSNLSHEIRTPMNAISGMVQLATRSKDFEDVKRCVSQIDISAKHLLQLLNDVLDISQIEEGKLSLGNQPFILDMLVDNVVSSMKNSANSQGVKLYCDMHGMHNKRVYGDSLRLSQVLINLLSNAIKFTPKDGRVTVSVEVQSTDRKKALIKFTVSDTGIGIPENAQQRIFSPFEQVDGSASRQQGGVGLGLAISQRIIRLMGSSIKVRSKEGSGSEFYFSIWFDTADGDAKIMQSSINQAEKAYDFKGAHVLIADDVAINREIIYSFLEGTGAVYEGAENGKEALDKFFLSEPGYYDVILMDVQMPFLDGCAATRAIRALERPDAQSVVILAMTANVFHEDMEHVVDAGMDGHIAKPVEYDDTMAHIERILEKKKMKRRLKQL